VKTEFLVQMQGVGHDDTGVLVLGATNLPWALDPAIRRRFERRIYISLPEYEARLGMLKKNLVGNNNSITDQDLDVMAKKT
jgi:vacuolar protein-sorting-associated protein 4